MANRSKEKGDRAEKELVDRLKEIPGVFASRIGLRLQSGRTVCGDVISNILGTELVFECKSRGGNKGWSQLVKWLAPVDVLTLKAEGTSQPLVVMNWELFQQLLTERHELYTKRMEHAADEFIHPDGLDLLAGGEVTGSGDGI